MQPRLHPTPKVSGKQPAIISPLITTIDPPRITPPPNTASFTTDQPQHSKPHQPQSQNTGIQHLRHNTTNLLQQLTYKRTHPQVLPNNT